MRAGPSRPTLYKLIVPRVGGNVRDYLELFVSATMIPSVNMETAMASGQEHMGITRQQPIALLYSKPLSIEVIGDADYNAYKELRGWFDLTVANANQSVIQRRSHRMRYYDTYVSDIELVKLEFPDKQSNNPDYNEPLRVKFINAYPVNISEIKLDSQAQHQIVRFTVDFTYESYSLSDEENPLNETFSNRL